VPPLPAVSFERILSEVKARYLVGLTATPQRRDGHQAITEMQLGPVRFRADARNQAAHRPFDHRLIVRDTAFRMTGDGQSTGIQQIYRVLANDEARNRRIVEDVIAAIHEGRSPILLTERKDHLEYFTEQLRGFVRHIVVLRGGMTAKERQHSADQLASISDTTERLVVATGRYIGEGFDDPRLDTLFLAMPVSWKGTLIQYSGRLHRRHPAKTEVRIYDYGTSTRSCTTLTGARVDSSCECRRAGSIRRSCSSTVRTRGASGVATVTTVGAHLVIDLWSEDESGDDRDDVELGVLRALVSIRHELMADDFRALYLAWRLRVQAGEIDGHARTPPMPDGTRRLTGSQQALVEFLRIDLP
jgi:superfamily II DNA or RNA helicase